MERPTKEQVDAVLAKHPSTLPCNPRRDGCILAAEVRALREERDLFRTAGEAAELRIVELREEVASKQRAYESTAAAFRATINRAEALVDRWNEMSFVVHPNECAEDLAAALQGES